MGIPKCCEIVVIHTPKTSICIVSYGKDAAWLVPLFKSCAKHLTGFHEIVLVFPTRDLKALEKYCPWLVNNKPSEGPNLDCPVRLVEFDEEPMDGHMASLHAKCSADEYCEGDFIAYMDSDCVWTTPTIPELFFDMTWIHRPIWLYTPFSIVDRKEFPSHWRTCTEEALGFPVEVETMRRHPSVVGSHDLKLFREHIEQVHGKALSDYLLPRKRHGQGSGTFSEFCALGAFMFYKRNHQYRFILDGPDAPPSNLHQFWSFHGVNHPDVQAKLKELDLL